MVAIDDPGNLLFEAVDGDVEHNLPYIKLTLDLD